MHHTPRIAIALLALSLHAAAEASIVGLTLTSVTPAGVGGELWSIPGGSTITGSYNIATALGTTRFIVQEPTLIVVDGSGGGATGAGLEGRVALRGNNTADPNVFSVEGSARTFGRVPVGVVGGPGGSATATSNFTFDLSTSISYLWSAEGDAALERLVSPGTYDVIAGAGQGGLMGMLLPGSYRVRIGSRTDYSFATGPSGTLVENMSSLSLQLGAEIVPLPPAAWAGLATLGATAIARRIRRRGASRS